MPTGKVRWFSDSKGYGFIQAEASEEDIFVHYSAVEMEGYRRLQDGQTVQFEAERSAKGLKATKVVPMN